MTMKTVLGRTDSWLSGPLRSLALTEGKGRAAKPTPTEAAPTGGAESVAFPSRSHSENPQKMISPAHSVLLAKMVSFSF